MYATLAQNISGWAKPTLIRVVLNRYTIVCPPVWEIIPSLKLMNYLLAQANKLWYRISSIIRQSFFPSKTIQKSRSVLLDRSRSLGLFRKGETCIIAKLQRTGVVICSHTRAEKTSSYS